MQHCYYVETYQLVLWYASNSGIVITINETPLISIASLECENSFVKTLSIKNHEEHVNEQTTYQQVYVCGIII